VSSNLSFYSIYSYNSYNSDFNAQDDNNSSFLSCIEVNNSNLNLSLSAPIAPSLDDNNFSNDDISDNKPLNEEISNFSICSWNVHGLASKLKFDTNLFFNFLNTFGIFILFETWIKADYDIFCFTAKLSNYDLYWTFASQVSYMGRAMGGILIGCKKDFKQYWKYDCYDNIPFLRHSHFNCLLVPVYISPNSWELVFTSYLNFFNQFNCNKFLIVGDFNARIGDKDIFHFQEEKIDCRTSKDMVVNGRGKKFLEFCSDFDLIILNGRKTFGDSEGNFTYSSELGNSVIDYALIGRQQLDFVIDFNVHFIAGSDHFPIVIIIKDVGNRSIIKPNLMPLLPKLNWKLQDAETYKSTILEKFNHINFDILDINHAVNSVNAVIDAVAVKKNCTGIYEQRWFDTECLKARNILHKSLANFKKCSTNDNHTLVYKNKKSYFELCRSKKRIYNDQLINNFDNISDASAFWSAINHIKKNTNFVSESIRPEEWFSYFNNLLNPVMVYHNFDLNFDFASNSDLDREFHLFELKLAINKLKFDKAPGADSIPNEFFKGLNDESLVIILKLLNRIFDGEGFPDNFINSIVFPLYKKGDLAIVSNFRGICFLSTFYKIYTLLLLERLNIFVFQHKILHENQAGFRKGYSTSDNIFVINSIVEDQLRLPKGKVFAFFIDFTAAFDTVNRCALIFKLKNLGFSSKCLNAIKAIYNKTKAKVWTKQGYTDDFFTNAGVRQGCVLSPLLFTLFINDLVDYINIGGFCYNGIWIRMLMYADDIVFLAKDSDILQLMINNLATYCDRWNLRVNLNKSKIMIFHKGSRVSKLFHWNFKQEEIEIVSNYKYLGINLVSTGKYESHLILQLNTAKLGLNSAYKGIFYLQSNNINSYFKIFDAVARSIMCYAAQIWGFQKYDEVEKLLRFFIKKLFRLPYNTPNYMLLLETGRDPLFLFTLKLHWSFILHTLKLNDNRFSKIMLEIGIVHEHKWFLNIKNFAMEFNLWEHFCGFQYNNIKPAFEQLLNCITAKERVDLLNQVMLGQFHPFYKELKLEWGREEYLNSDFSYNEKRYIFMARSEMLPLNWKPWFVNNNFKCLLCNYQADENITHFIKDCPVLNGCRPFQFRNYTALDILKGKCNYKFLANFVISALKTRNIILQEFNF